MMTDLPYLRDEAQAEEWRKNAQQLQKLAYLGWDAVREAEKTGENIGALGFELADLIVKAESAEQRWRDLSGDRDSCLFGERGCAPEGPGLAWCAACADARNTNTG